MEKKFIDLISAKYLKKDLPYRRAIWHGFVTAAAATHFAAIMTGVVLPAGA